MLLPPRGVRGAGWRVPGSAPRPPPAPVPRPPGHGGGEAASGRGGWDHLEFGTVSLTPRLPRYLALRPLASSRSAGQAGWCRGGGSKTRASRGVRAGGHGEVGRGRAGTCGRARALGAPCPRGPRDGEGFHPASLSAEGPGRPLPVGCGSLASVVSLPGPSLQTPRPIAVTPAAPSGGARAGQGERKRCTVPGAGAGALRSRPSPRHGRPRPP